MKFSRQLLIAILISSIIGGITYSAVSRYVLNKAEENLADIMLSHRSFHHYIQQVMHPVYYRAKDAGQVDPDFYAPEILSSSFVVRVMHGYFNAERVTSGLPPIYYKLAATNPRNPLNRADEKEASLIRLFNDRRDLKEYREITTINGKKHLSYAKPFLETNQACIRCHGNRKDAPEGLQRIYSGLGGFGETAGTIRAIESIRIPLDNEFTAVYIVSAVSLSGAAFLMFLSLFNSRLRARVNQKTSALEQEIVERTLTEEKLKNSEENWRSFADLTSDYVHKCTRIVPEPYRIQWIGGSIGSISGYSVDEIQKMGCWLPLVHQDDRQTVASYLLSLAPGDVKEIEFKIVTKNNDVRWICEKSRCEKGHSDGELVLLGAATDITERRSMEEILRLTRVSVDAAADAIFWITPEARIMDVNAAACQSLGYTREELLQLSVPEVDTHYNDDMWQQHFAELQEKGTLKFESEQRKKDGTVFPVEIAANYIKFGTEERNCAFVRDITERKRIEKERQNFEKQLLHAQKLESLGVLAGGIAHDFNNILMSIIGNADLALMRINKESPAVENLHRIEQASARAADLTKQMLAYSGKGKFVIEHIDLNLLLEEMLHMLEVISKKAVLRLNYTRPLPSVTADATQMRQIIMNLVINASEAIGDKSGVIAISTGCMDCDRNYLKDVWLDENLHDGLYVYLEIADSGCGMDKQTMAKIFDPFFTTKFTGRGLGMAAVLGIVKGHKGAIKVYSEPQKGTTFKILLPASDRPAEIFNGEAHKDDWKGSGTVLLVDDEETIRGITG